MPIYRERPGYSKDVIDSALGQQKRDRPGYSRDVIKSPEEKQARLQQRRDRLNAESAEETGQATANT